MKRLISEEEICDCRNTNSIFNLNRYVLVEVAEEKIKNIAIGFATYITEYGYKPEKQGYYSKTSNVTINIYTEEQLFNKFIEHLSL